MDIEYAIVIRNKTRLEALIERFNTRAQAKFYIDSLGGSFADYEAEHEMFYQSLHTLQSRLARSLKYKIVEKTFLPSYIFAENQLIIVIGQDGLVANTAKYARGRPIIGVNPDPRRYDGVLLPFDADSFVPALEHVATRRYRTRTVRFAEARLNDGQRLLAFNELFIGAASHVSARYRITFNDKVEDHSSSGIIISTPAGATGWLSSVFNMAYGITGLRGKDIQPKPPSLKEDQLLFAVREPFKSVNTQADIVTGLLTDRLGLTVESLMPAGGVIFSDGIESDFLQFNSGATARIGISRETANLVI